MSRTIQNQSITFVLLFLVDNADSRLRGNDDTTTNKAVGGAAGRGPKTNG